MSKAQAQRRSRLSYCRFPISGSRAGTASFRQGGAAGWNDQTAASRTWSSGVGSFDRLPRVVEDPEALYAAGLPAGSEDGSGFNTSAGDAPPTTPPAPRTHVRDLAATTSLALFFHDLTDGDLTTATIMAHLPPRAYDPDLWVASRAASSPTSRLRLDATHAPHAGLFAAVIDAMDLVALVPR